MTKVAEIDAPKSAFVQAMEAAIQRRLAAPTGAGKAAVDREIAAIVRQYLGRNAWRVVTAGMQAAIDKAKREAERETRIDGVPRATSRDRVCHTTRKARAGHGPRREFPEDFDYKALQAGEKGDDE